MQAAGMTDDEVRDLFSAYHDRELSPEESEKVRKALEANPELQKEYDSFAKMLDGLAGLSIKTDAAPPLVEQKPAEGAPQVDLLAGVQSRLHKRSGGKFYRDRWSRTVGVFPLELIAALVLVGLVFAYYAMTSVTIEKVERPAPSPPEVAPQAPAR